VPEHVLTFLMLEIFYHNH